MKIAYPGSSNKDILDKFAETQKIEKLKGAQNRVQKFLHVNGHT